MKKISIKFLKPNDNYKVYMQKLIKIFYFFNTILIFLTPIYFIILIEDASLYVYLNSKLEIMNYSTGKELLFLIFDPEKNNFIEKVFAGISLYFIFLIIIQIILNITQKFKNDEKDAIKIFPMQLTVFLIVELLTVLLYYAIKFNNWGGSPAIKNIDIIEKKDKIIHKELKTFKFIRKFKSYYYDPKGHQLFYIDKNKKIKKCKINKKIICNIEINSTIDKIDQNRFKQVINILKEN